MTKLTTADVQNWLATDPKVYDLVCAYCGDLEGTDGSEWDAYCLKVLKDAKNPKKWIRQRKYAVGSPTDMDLGIRLGEGFSILDPKDRPPDLTGGIVREFWLKDTDHITILTVEKDSKIIFIEDLSD